MARKPDQCDIDAFARITKAYNMNKKALEKEVKKTIEEAKVVKELVATISNELQESPVKMESGKADAAARDIVKLMLECS